MDSVKEQCVMGQNGRGFGLGASLILYININNLRLGSII